ncbi:MAG: anion permease [Gemmatimonadales bacterium]|jgi:DASS family divalent anion:Na+ symporter
MTDGSGNSRSTVSTAIRYGIPIGLAALIWLLPSPQGVTTQAWHLFAIFVATIVGIMLEPLPMGAVAIAGITAAIVSRTLTVSAALSGFSNGVIWLVMTAFFISRGFIKTGLGARIAYSFVRLLGKNTLGLGYSMSATELVLAPAIPSNTARAGAVIYPIVRSMAAAFDSRPGDGSERRIGAFLIKNSFQANLITSAMFLTAMAANPLAAQLAAEQGVTITWTAWAAAAFVPGLISLVTIPLILYRLYPPEVKETPQATRMAREKLAQLGPMKRDEQIMLGTFVLLLALWTLSQPLQMSSTATAFIGLTLLLATGVLKWQDVLAEKGAWNVFIWLSTLIMMGSYLSQLGFVAWFSGSIGNLFSQTGWLPAFVGLSLIYFYSHYFFAGNTAHISSMYAAFLAVALAAGTPPLLAALVLGFFSNLFSSMTHYSTGPAPVFFGSGYVKVADWWRLGAVVSVVNIAIWLGIGGVWWKVIGLW